MLPDFEKDFPYIASRAELDKYIGCCVPWHWHRTEELFYVIGNSYHIKRSARIALRRLGSMSQKRPAAGGESCKQDSFSYGKRQH